VFPQLHFSSAAPEFGGSEDITQIVVLEKALLTFCLPESSMTLRLLSRL
jgi:hypothetical protein